jgi:hypothetical protein
MTRSLRALVAAAGAVAVLAGCGGTAAPEPATDDAATVRTGRDSDAQFTVAATDLGIHSFTTRPELPTASIRLNCFPGWSWVNTARDEYSWVDFDRVVTQAEQWGYSDILYVFCSTPQWAGEPSATPDQGAFGPGSAQPPADMADFDAYVRAVMDRYRGRIDGYEVWNEPGSPQFFTGTPAQMGQMTAIVARAADELDPAAYVASAGFQTNRPELYESFIPQYFADLRRRGWPIDVVSAHFYPGGRGTPESRVDQIRRVRNDLDRYGAPTDLALWDTEVNYEVDRPGGAP